jgi:hypothetical protein
VIHFKIWQAPVLAFFSTKFYRDLATNGKGVGFVYMLTLLAIMCTIQPIHFYFTLKDFMNGDGRAIVDVCPNIKIQNGKLSIDEPSPYVVALQDIPLITFYADDKSQAEMPAEPNSPMVVTQDSMKVLIPFQPQPIVWPLSFKGVTFAVTKKDIRSMLDMSCITVPMLLYVTNLTGFWIRSILTALFFSVMALIVAKCINAHCTYPGLLRISSVAVGCTIIISCILQLVPLHFPGINEWGEILALFLIAGGYTLFGTGATLSQQAFVPVGHETPGQSE